MLASPTAQAAQSQSGKAPLQRPSVIRDGIIAPYEQAAFQAEEPLTYPTPLCLHDFETLSLAARAALAGTNCDGIGLAMADGEKPRSLFPEIDTADLLAVIGEAVAYLDLTGPFGGRRPPHPGDPETSGAARLRTALRSGLQIVGCLIRDIDGGAPSLRLANLHIPFSLRFIGCVIESPVVANHCELQTLDLSGSAVAGLDAASLYARGNIRLRRTTMLSPANFGGARVGGVFDATDSVMQPRGTPPRDEAFAAERGMLNLGQAHFENDVYLNRARIWGGLNLRGAVIDRSLFLNRTLIRCPVAILERLGCEVLKPLLEDWNEGERLPGHIGLDTDEALCAIKELIDDNTRLVEHLHPDGDGIDCRRRRKAETIGREDFERTDPGNGGQAGFQPALRQLLSDSMRARTSAIRADSLTVQGNIFGRNMKTMGRIRLKYARVGAGLHLEGSRLRSVAAIGRVLDTFRWIAKEGAPEIHDQLGRYHRLRIETRGDARRHDSQKDDDFALDLREATFGGSVVLSSHSEADAQKAEPPSTIAKGTGQQGTSDRSPERRPTRIDGVIAADGVRIRGDLIVVQAEFISPPKQTYDDAWKDGVLDKEPDPDRLKAGDHGDWEREAAKIAMDWRARLEAEAQQGLDPDFRGRTPTSLRLPNSEIEGDLDLRESRRLFGLDFENAKLSGSLVFSDKISKAEAAADRRPSPPNPPRAHPLILWPPRQFRRSLQYRKARKLIVAARRAAFVRAKRAFDKDDAVRKSLLRCERRAQAVSGSLTLRNSQIGGDAILVFSPAKGPNIKAEFVRIEGRLDIYPQSGSSQRDHDDLFRSDFEGFEESNFAEETKRWEARLRLKETRGSLDQEATRDQEIDPGPLGEKPRYIDLRNARAEAFCHPPPAWPSQGGLSLEGFDYARSHPFGPLAPHPFPFGPRLVRRRLRHADKIEADFKLPIEQPARLVLVALLILLIATPFLSPSTSLPGTLRGIGTILAKGGS
ncbi:MAG: hypothetical protein JSR98_19805 [Proteobacteria bacterium]|nr:hypothetical protein [Pseudomonadota bacterium]